MKTIGILLTLALLVPIYVLPWVGGAVQVDGFMGAMETPDPDLTESEYEAAIDAAGEDIGKSLMLAFKIWLAQAACYALLVATPLVFSSGARWTCALMAGAAVFDLMPVLDWIPFVPTVLILIAFVFMAKAQPAVEKQQ